MKKDHLIERVDFLRDSDIFFLTQYSIFESIVTYYSFFFSRCGLTLKEIKLRCPLGGTQIFSSYHTIHIKNGQQLNLSHILLIFNFGIFAFPAFSVLSPLLGRVCLLKFSSGFHNVFEDERLLMRVSSRKKFDKQIPKYLNQLENSCEFSKLNK